MKQFRAGIGLLLLLIVWHLVSLKQSVLIPPLSQIGSQFWFLLESGLLLEDMVSSVFRIMLGLVISTSLAIVLGLIAAFWAQFSDYLSAIFELVRPVPPIAWVPVAIIAFGIGYKAAVAIVALGSFFPIWLGIQQGLANLNHAHLLAARSLGAGRVLTVFEIIVPSVFPYFLHGLRLGVGIAWFCVIAAEMVGSTSGLGYGVQLFSLNIEMPRVYCYLLAIGVLGLCSNYLVQHLSDRLVKWR